MYEISSYMKTFFGSMYEISSYMKTFFGSMYGISSYMKTFFGSMYEISSCYDRGFLIDEIMLYLIMYELFHDPYKVRIECGASRTTYSMHPLCDCQTAETGKM